MKKIVKLLRKKNKTISTMESCTGGYLVSSITDEEGSSDIIKFSAVTYSNDFKIKMGVSEAIIKKYTVYSLETANEMSKKIAMFASSNYGVGITGQINRPDQNNIVSDSNKIYISIYDKDLDKYYNKVLIAKDYSRKENKIFIVEEVKDMLEKILQS